METPLETTPNPQGPIQRFTAWYQQQGLILFLLLLPIVLLLWLTAVAKYYFIKFTKGTTNDYIHTS